MKYTQIKIGLLSIALLLSSANVVAAAKPATKSVKAEMVLPEAAAAQDAEDRASRDDDDDQCPPLKVANLCAKHIKAKSLVAKKICSHKLHTDHLTAENATVTEKLCANDLRAPVACLGDLTAQNICSNGTTKVADFQQCGKYRATAVFDDMETYTLGCNLNFDLVLDDPNGNYTTGGDDPSVCGRVSYYTAPFSGYYIVTLEVDQQNIRPFDGNPILGAPVGNLHIDVNGTVHREAFFPYLTFFNAQSATLTALVSLKAGDQVSGHYEVYAVSQTAGFISIAGTVDVIGNGKDSDNSIFKIHYLSSDCIDLPCGGCDFTCESATEQPCPKLDCNPCCHRD